MIAVGITGIQYPFDRFLDENKNKERIIIPAIKTSDIKGMKIDEYPSHGCNSNEYIPQLISPEYHMTKDVKMYTGKSSSAIRGIFFKYITKVSLIRVPVGVAFFILILSLVYRTLY